MTLQQIYNKVAKHLFKQGRPAMALFGSKRYKCTYLNADGLKCAIGCLIKKEYYHQSLETNNISYPPVMMAIYNSINVKKEDKNLLFYLLNRLQVSHDYAEKSTKTEKFLKIPLKKELREVAKKYNLSPKVLETV